MACLSPVTAYYSKEVNPSGKRSLVFRKDASHSGVPLQIACGQCINCRVQRASAGAIRCVHEAKSHEVNAFVTLTYSPENMPEDGGLHHRDFQLFMKRVRKWWRKNCGNHDPKFKMIMCGEYGETTARPHYHALLFGCDFPDRKYFKRANGNRLDTSQILDDLWQLGHTTVGDVSYESARYVCGYVLKKVTGKKADDYYMGRRPDYITWGNGIGAAYFAQYGAANYDHDYVVIDGRKMPIPRYYDTKFELVDTARLKAVKSARVRSAFKFSKELKARENESGLYNTFNARNTVARSRLNKRDYDDT